jgi:periplasmic mercuric ion binding protein
MKKAVLVCLVMMFAVSLAAFAAGEQGKSALPEGQAQVHLAISGMTCGSCCAKVETAAKALPGVVDATADYKKGEATITYETAKVNVDKIVATINEKTSFKAKAEEKKA